MQLTKWDPFRDMDDMFERYARALNLPRRSGQEGLMSVDWSPQVDIAETEEAFSVVAELPGMKKDDISLSVENGVLSIKGERKQETEEKKKKVHRVERFYGSFQRSFNLPENVDPQKIEADFRDGVLEITLPKTAVSEPRSIDVKIR